MKTKRTAKKTGAARTAAATRASALARRKAARHRHESDLARETANLTSSTASGAEYARTAREGLPSLTMLTPPVESELDRELARAEGTAASLEADVRALADCLAPVLRKGAVDVGTAGRPNTESPVGGRLSDVTERLSSTRDVVSSLLARVAV